MLIPCGQSNLPEIVPALMNRDMRALANAGDLPTIVWGEAINENSVYAKA